MLHLADYIFIAVFVLSMLYSFMRGFVREALSVVIWFFAFWAALHYASYISPLLIDFVTHAVLRFAASFIILLVLILIVGTLVSHMIGYFVKTTGLSGTDRSLGLLFGFIRGALIIFVVLFIVQLIYHKPPLWWQQSVCIKQFWYIMQPMHYMLPTTLQQHINPVYLQVR